MSPLDGDLSLKSFLSGMGIAPQDLRLFQDAFTHRSYLNESKNSGLSSNERLEFLGDAVLGLLACRYLYLKYPGLSEGQLAKAKAALISEPTLAGWGRELALGSQLRFGKGEEKSGGRDKEALVADCLEALLGAIYLDSGLEPAAVFLAPFFNQAQNLLPGTNVEDAKTRLQEWAQHHFKQPPQYRVVSATGPDHERVFEIEVTVKGMVLATGRGKNKKEAEQSAAALALKDIVWGGE